MENGPHLRSNQITAFGHQGEPTTAVEWLNQIMTAYGWISLPMTASGWKDYNAIGWQPYQLLYLITCYGSNLYLEISKHPSFYNLPHLVYGVYPLLCVVA